MSKLCFYCKHAHFYDMYPMDCDASPMNENVVIGKYLKRVPCHAMRSSGGLCGPEARLHEDIGFLKKLWRKMSTR